MNIESEQRVSWKMSVTVISLALFFFVIVPQFLPFSAANVYFLVSLGVFMVLLFGVMGWERWVHGVPEQTKERRQALSNRMFHWTLGLPADTDQFFIFLLTIGADLCIFSSVYWMLQSYYVPERKGILMALLPVFLLHIGKILAELNLHPFVHGQTDVKSLFYWRSIVGSILALSFGVAVLFGVWYLLKLLYRREGISVLMVVNVALMFFVLGGKIFSMDFDDFYDRTGGSRLLIGLVFLFAVSCLILFCLLYSTLLIELERTL